MTASNSPLAAAAGADLIDRLLDPAERFAVFHRNLPELRTELGPDRSERLETIVADLLEEIAWSYRRELAQIPDYDGYRRFLREVSLVAEAHFRSDPRVWRDLPLDEETLQRILPWLKCLLMAHLEIRC